MRRLVIALLVLVGVLVVADFGAAALAESAVSRQMRSQLGLADDPSVRINGFPFLTQAVAGEYGSVDVEAQRITLGQLRELGVRAQLRNVSAPLPMLLGSGPKTLQVRAAEGTVRVPANDVQRLMPGVQKLRIETVDEGALERAIDDGADVSLGDIDPDQAVRLVGTSTLLGTSSRGGGASPRWNWSTGRSGSCPATSGSAAETPGPAGGRPGSRCSGCSPCASTRARCRCR